MTTVYQVTVNGVPILTMPDIGSARKFAWTLVEALQETPSIYFLERERGCWETQGATDITVSIISTQEALP